MAHPREGADAAGRGEVARQRLPGLPALEEQVQGRGRGEDQQRGRRKSSDQGEGQRVPDVGVGGFAEENQGEHPHDRRRRGHQDRAHPVHGALQNGLSQRQGSGSSQSVDVIDEEDRVVHHDPSHHDHADGRFAREVRVRVEEHQEDPDQGHRHREQDAQGQQQRLEESRGDHVHQEDRHPQHHVDLPLLFGGPLPAVGLLDGIPGGHGRGVDHRVVVEVAQLVGPAEFVRHRTLVLLIFTADRGQHITWPDGDQFSQPHRVPCRGQNEGLPQFDDVDFAIALQLDVVADLVTPDLDLALTHLPAHGGGDLTDKVLHGDVVAGHHIPPNIDCELRGPFAVEVAPRGIGVDVPDPGVPLEASAEVLGDVADLFVVVPQDLDPVVGWRPATAVEGRPVAVHTHLGPREAERIRKELLLDAHGHVRAFELVGERDRRAARLLRDVGDEFFDLGHLAQTLLEVPRQLFGALDVGSAGKPDRNVDVGLLSPPSAPDPPLGHVVLEEVAGAGQTRHGNGHHGPRPAQRALHQPPVEPMIECGTAGARVRRTLTVAGGQDFSHQRRDEAECDEERRQQTQHDDDRKRQVVDPEFVLQIHERDEDDQRRGRGRDDRKYHLRRTLEGSLVAPGPGLPSPVDVFEHHDGVVHDEPEAHCEPHQG